MLWFPLMINSRTIGRVEILRQTPLESEEAEHDYTYKVERYKSPLNGGVSPRWRSMSWKGVVRHRYWDGGFELVRKVMEAIHEQSPTLDCGTGDERSGFPAHCNSSCVEQLQGVSK